MWPFHKHTWRVLRVDPGTIIHFWGEGGDGTNVYWKCTSCGKVKVDIYEGHWRLSDFER